MLSPCYCYQDPFTVNKVTNIWDHGSISSAPGPCLNPRSIEYEYPCGSYRGEHERSSENFTVVNSATYEVKVKPEITFDIKKDVGFWSDPVVYAGVRNRDNIELRSNENYYIANPSGATQDFSVELRKVSL